MNRNQNSDYVLNKYNKDGIVYRFVDGSVVIVTLEDYLAQNPSKAEKDFRELKKLSDNDYHGQHNAELRVTRKNISIFVLDASVRSLDPLPDEVIISGHDRDMALIAFGKLLSEGKLTKKQERRLLLYIVEGLSLRQIAEREGIDLSSAKQSVDMGREKLKKIVENFS